jgi:predicted MFS family arabinose efflux permease
VPVFSWKTNLKGIVSGGGIQSSESQLFRRACGGQNVASTPPPLLPAIPPLVSPRNELVPPTSRQRFRALLYLICTLTDWSTFVVTFTVTRSLAEGGATPLQLGLLGAGFSFAAAVASIASGLAALRWGPPTPFLAGTATLLLAILGCRQFPSDTAPFLAAYVSLGLGLGGLYPPLIGWLNQGEAGTASQRSGVSGRLILFCIAWNLGIMAGQLTGGSLFTQGPPVALGVALLIAIANLGLALWAAWQSARLPRVPQIPSPSGGDHQRAAAFQKLSWLANLGGMFGGSLVLHLISDLAVSIGIAAERQGEVMALWRVVIIGTYLLMHFATFWQFRMAPSIVSQILGAAGLVVIAQAQSPLSLLAGLALLGQLVGYNYFSGLFYSASGNPAQNRALTAAIHEATLAAGMAVGTTVGGALGNLVGHRVPYLLGAVVVWGVLIAQWIGWWWWVRPLDRETKHGG